MSTGEKHDPARAAAWMMGLLYEDEARRIEALSEEEFLAEERAKGREPVRTPSVEELIAKARAAAARREARIGATGAAKGETAGAEVPERSGVTEVAGGAKVVAMRGPRPRVPGRVLWGFSAAAMVLLFIGTWDTFHPATGAHAPPGGGGGHGGTWHWPWEQTPLDEALDLLDRAQEKCDAKRWKECRELLDREEEVAPWLADARKEKMRQEVAEGLKGR